MCIFTKQTCLNCYRIAADVQITLNGYRAALRFSVTFAHKKRLTEYYP